MHTYALARASVALSLWSSDLVSLEGEMLVDL